MPTPQHYLTFGPQAAQRAAAGFTGRLGTPAALQEAATIMQRAGVPLATAGQAVVEHIGYLFGLTPLNKVRGLLR
jgi:hypothetical protein